MSYAARTFAAAALALAAAAPALALPADFKAKADTILAEAYAADGPGAAVIVTDDGKVVYAAGRGLADLEAKKPITPKTVFRLGSITKQISAAVLLQLVEEGKVKLTDRVSRYVPSLPKPGADATIAQILNHTVGVQSYTSIPGWMAEENTNRPYTTEQMIALFKDLPAPSKPGEKWDYNNSGYVLVGAVIEAATGKPWHQAVDERIVKPLGLKSIRYGIHEASIPTFAKGYTRGEAGPVPARKIHMSVPHAAGALVGSVEDLAKWAHALHHGKVLKSETYAQMIAPTPLPDGTTYPYGFGLGLDTLRGKPTIGHGGGIFGFSTDSLYVPEDDVFVAVFTNSDEPKTSPSIVAQRLAALAAGNPFPAFARAKVDVAALEPLFGIYRVEGEGGGERRFFARDGKLYTQRSGGPELEVHFGGGNRYHYGAASLSWFEIKRDVLGKPVMEMHQNGADEAERAVHAGPIPPPIPTVEVPRALLERYAGTYRAPIGTAVVALTKAGLTIRLGGQPAFPLRPVGPALFRVEAVDAQVTFRTRGDAVTGLQIKQGGREIEAERVKAP